MNLCPACLEMTSHEICDNCGIKIDAVFKIHGVNIFGVNKFNKILLTQYFKKAYLSEEDTKKLIKWLQEQLNDFK